MSETKFKASPFYLAPVSVSLIIGVFCAALFLYSQTSLESITAFPEAGFGPFLNAVIFVTLVAVGGTLIYLLLKRGIQRLIRSLIGVSITAVTFTLSVLYFDMLFGIVGFIGGELWAWILAVLLTVVVDVEVFYRDGMFHEAVIVVLGGAFGTFLAASIPCWSAVSILLLLAAYDVVAVYKGPIGKMTVEGLERLPGISFAFREIRMGLGDLTFYSMLVARMLLSFGWLVCFAAAVGVLFGSYSGFKMLERRKMFPGLPLSVVFGLAAGCAVLVLF